MELDAEVVAVKRQLQSTQQRMDALIEAYDAARAKPLAQRNEDEQETVQEYRTLQKDRQLLLEKEQWLQQGGRSAGTSAGVDVTKALAELHSKLDCIPGVDVTKALAELHSKLDKQKEDVIEATAKAAKAAEDAAQRTEQQLKDTQTALLDDIRSWNSSHSTEASRVSLSNIQLLRRLLRIRMQPFDDTDPTTVLHPNACDSDYEWDNTPEPSQRQQYMMVIAENTQHGLFDRIVWKPQTKAEIVVRGLGHRVVAKSDELLCARKWQFLPDAGCLIGIELKKDLTQAARRQGEAEFIAFSLTSNFPFLQLVTDMKRGGFAYYKQADEDGHQVVTEQVLQGMGSMYDVLNAALSSLPNSLTAVRGEVHVPQQLQSPQRCKLVDPFIMQAAASVHDAGPDCGDDALEDLSAWFSKEQLVATGDLPDACTYADQETL